MKSTTTKSFIRNITTIVVIAGGVLLSSQATAASKCKGLENAACNSQTACSWVQSYERKDGKTVNAFCRTKAKRAVKKTQQGK